MTMIFCRFTGSGFNGNSFKVTAGAKDRQDHCWTEQDVCQTLFHLTFVSRWIVFSESQLYKQFDESILSFRCACRTWAWAWACCRTWAWSNWFLGESSSAISLQLYFYKDVLPKLYPIYTTISNLFRNEFWNSYHLCFVLLQKGFGSKFSWTGLLKNKAG